MSDYNKLKSDPDHMASIAPNALANEAAVAVSKHNPTKLPGPINVGGNEPVTPGHLPTKMFHDQNPPVKPASTPRP